MSEIRELDVLALWKRGGKLPAWVCWVITSACAITILIALVGPNAFYDQGARVREIPRFWFRNGLAIHACVWIALTAMFGWRLSRFVRVAILLPILHLITMVIAWKVWTLVTPSQGVTLSDHSSIELLVVAFAATCGGGGWLVARRRRREWIHGTVMIALSFVLLLGLWLPIASHEWCKPIFYEWERGLLPREISVKLIAFVLLPPLASAVTFAAVALRRPAMLRRYRTALATGLTLLLFCAIADRTSASVDACLLYANLLPYVLSMGLVAIASLVVLAGSSWTRPLRRATHEGVIAFDDAPPVVAYFQITSWLRGPQAALRSFIVRTNAGDIPVPSGAKLAIPLPDLTTQLKAGESLEVLRCGDRVLLDGFIEPDRDHPFRGSLALMPGSRGITVGKPDADAAGFEGVALAIWRPCVAYLLIVTAIGIPALAAILTN